MTGTGLIGRGVLLGAALALGGCSLLGTSGSGPAAAATSPPATAAPPPVTAPQPPARPPRPSTASAWRPLVQKADQAAARGDYEQALALLERALRIDPESGEIYLHLARTQRSRGDEAQARAAAERGMLYCSDRAQCDALRALTR
jgi:tetratricopeptide (TPR) repeat protein